MKKSFMYEEAGKTGKFWNIHVMGREYCVNFGTQGRIGRFQIKDFKTEAAALAAAQKLVAQKIKKGYVERAYDDERYFYVDDDEFGPHRLTSHPRFVAHFTSDCYYDCGEEEAPFGNDAGADALPNLADYIKKNKNINIDKFPKMLIEERWGMDYIPPEVPLETPDDDTLVGEMLQSDQVNIASAFGQIKIMGSVSKRLKDMAIASYARMQKICQMMGYESSELTSMMCADLETFKAPEATPSALAQDIMAYLNCPCEVFSPLLDDDDIVYSYEKALKSSEKEGYIPLLVVVSDLLFESMTLALDLASEMRFDPVIREQYREDTLKKAEALSPKQCFERREAEAPQEKLSVGTVSGGKGIERFTSFWNYSSGLTHEVILAKFPITKPWLLPIYAPMGGFNDCPLPEEQAAIMKHWYETYRAVPAVVGYSTWEFFVHNDQALDNPTAMRLAWEHYLFCRDRGERYTKKYTLGEFADCIKKSKVWYFWWD